MPAQVDAAHIQLEGALQPLSAQVQAFLVALLHLHRGNSLILLAGHALALLILHRLLGGNTLEHIESLAHAFLDSIIVPLILICGLRPWRVRRAVVP